MLWNHQRERIENLGFTSYVEIARERFLFVCLFVCLFVFLRNAIPLTFSFRLENGRGYLKREGMEHEQSPKVGGNLSQHFCLYYTSEQHFS